MICQWRANQITDKSRYYVTTEVNNYFIIRSPSLFSYLNHSLTAQGSDLPFLMFYPRAWFPLRMSRILFAQTIFSRQLFASHVVGSRPMKSRKQMHRMIMWDIYGCFACHLEVDRLLLTDLSRSVWENLTKLKS